MGSLKPNKLKIPKASLRKIHACTFCGDLIMSMGTWISTYGYLFQCGCSNWFSDYAGYAGAKLRWHTFREKGDYFERDKKGVGVLK